MKAAGALMLHRLEMGRRQEGKGGDKERGWDDGEKEAGARSCTAAVCVKKAMGRGVLGSTVVVAGGGGADDMEAEVGYEERRGC